MVWDKHDDVGGSVRAIFSLVLGLLSWGYLGILLNKVSDVVGWLLARPLATDAANSEASLCQRLRGHGLQAFLQIAFHLLELLPQAETKGRGR